MPQPPRPPRKSASEVDVARAAKLSRMPGVTPAEAAPRFAVKPAAVSRARKTTPALSIAQLALGALTEKSARTSGALSATVLAQIAGFIDYVTHDACNADDVRALLAEHAQRGNPRPRPRSVDAARAVAVMARVCFAKFRIG